MTMETKWTPGPWVVDPEENWIVTEWRSTEHGLQTLICDMMDEEAPQYEANAHLIAAAPELYEALLECVEEIRAVNMVDGEIKDKDTEAVYTKAKAALRKARGE